MCSALPSISSGLATDYFNDILQQVAQIAGNASATVYAVIDERGLRVAGTLDPSGQQAIATRAFPLLFFDPTLIAVDPPDDLHTAVLDRRNECRRRSDVRAGGARRAAEPHRRRRGGRVARIGLLATARAARASAAVATIRADFVATVTHELKTPLSTIRAVGETLVRGRIKTEQDLNRYAHLLVREERRLTRLVNNLLAYSRVTDVTEVYSFEALEPAALIAEATQGFRRQLTDGAVRLDVDVAPDIPAVRADRTAIVLALDNLIDNAIRYSGAGTTVSVRGSAEGNHVRFDVIDREQAYPPTICRRSEGDSSAEYGARCRQRTGPGDCQSDRSRSRRRARDRE